MDDKSYGDFNRKGKFIIVIIQFMIYYHSKWTKSYQNCPQTLNSSTAKLKKEDKRFQASEAGS